MSLTPQQCKYRAGFILGVNLLTQAGPSAQTSGRCDSLLLCSQMNGVEGNEGRNCHFLSPHSLADPLLGCMFTFCLAGHSEGEPTSWPEKYKWERRGHVMPGVTWYHHSRPLFCGEGWKCCFCGVDANAFEKHSFHHSSERLYQLL